MKNFDLNSFGQQEILKDLEMKVIFGGWDPAKFVKRTQSKNGSDAEMSRTTQDAAWGGSTSGTGCSDGSGV